MGPGRQGQKVKMGRKKNRVNQSQYLEGNLAQYPKDRQGLQKVDSTNLNPIPDNDGRVSIRTNPRLRVKGQRIQILGLFKILTRKTADNVKLQSKDPVTVRQTRGPIRRIEGKDEKHLPIGNSITLKKKKAINRRVHR